MILVVNKKVTAHSCNVIPSIISPTVRHPILYDKHPLPYRHFHCAQFDLIWSIWVKTIHEDPEDHYNDVIMGAIACQITSLTIVYSTVYSDSDQRKHQSSASLAIARWIHRGPVNSPHKWPVTRKIFQFDDVIMWVATADPLGRICNSII